MLYGLNWLLFPAKIVVKRRIIGSTSCSPYRIGMVKGKMRHSEKKKSTFSIFSGNSPELRYIDVVA